MDNVIDLRRLWLIVRRNGCLMILLYLVISSVGASILLSVEGLTLVVFMTLITSNDNKQGR